MIRRTENLQIEFSRTLIRSDARDIVTTIINSDTLTRSNKFVALSDEELIFNQAL